LQAAAELSWGREQAVRVPVGDGELAALYLQAPAAGELAALVLHGWGGNRNGPHDLLTRLARELAAEGVASLRFDFRGRGESSEAPGRTSLDSMGDDAVAAGRWLLAQGAKRLLVVGICSGGNVGIGVLDRLEPVAGLYLMSVYPFSDGDSFGRDARRTAHMVATYWQKALRGQTWKRLLRGELDLGGVGRALFGHFRKRSAQEDDAGEEEQGEVRPSPLRNLLRHRPPMRMIYGAADPDCAASVQYFKAFAEAAGYPLYLRRIPGANHNFYSLAWKRELATELRDFARQTRSRDR